ncbi:IS5 family transposase [Burkholderia sp. Nafp2/4-1b]|uniref:IS5 family transposase n=1 Tax=Burkholderia sp. Nafp2/4-1b TaxID=2116686 RepID=UPI001F098724|nr:IS5 family transposase [Burkholderia sp. Nafp2/4-1b]
MKQKTFASLSYETKKRVTRREKFLMEMGTVVPWQRLIALIEPVYPKAGPKGGRPVMPLATMLRIYFMQQWFALSDPAMEDALYDSESMRRFAGLELNEDAMPSDTAMLRFRHLLEPHELAAAILAEVNAMLGERGLLLRECTIVDATLIHAPSSTKNAKGKRDPEMSQTKKGNQWYFGMKAHIGVDAESGIVHSVVTTTAKVNDKRCFDELLHGEETAVWGDRGYDIPDIRRRCAERGISAGIARRKQPGEPRWRIEREINHVIAKVRARVEHPFRIIKRQFGYVKTRYRGLAKNTAQIVTLFVLGNLYLTRRQLAN